MAYYDIGSGQSSVGLTLVFNEYGYEDFMEVYDGGIASYTTVTSQSFLNVSSGGTAFNTMVGSSGYMSVSSGGTAFNTMVGSRGYMSVSSGGTASGTTVNSGMLYVQGGFISGTTVAGQSAQLAVYSNGTAVSTTVNSGGSMEIHKNGTVINTTLSGKDAIMCLDKGGTAVSTFVHSGGSMRIEGGSANYVSVGLGGKLKVKEDGVATNVVWTPTEGKLSVDERGTITFASAYTGVYLGQYGHLLSHAAVMNDLDIGGQTMVIMPGGTADNCTVGPEGCVSVWSGASVNGLRVDGGELNVFSGGTATNVVWTPTEGCIYFYDGAVITYASSYSGVYYGSKGKLLSHADVISNKAVAGPDMYVFSGGTAVSITLVEEAAVRVDNGGTIISASVYGDESELHVASGGIALAATVFDDACIDVDSGGTVVNTVLYDESNLEISGGAAASGTVVFGSRCKFEVDDGSYAENTVINGGTMRVSRGGRADHVTVNQSGDVDVRGGAIDNVTVNSGGWMGVSSGGTATGVTVSAGGILYMAVAPDIYVQGASNGIGFVQYNGYLSGYHAGPNNYLNVLCGGTADHTTVFGGSSSYIPDMGGYVIYTGWIYVSSGGTAKNTTIEDGGYLYVSSGGTAKNTVINDGDMTVLSGGKVTGSLNIASGADVWAEDGGIIDFDISRLAAYSPALVNDLSLIRGTPDYTVTVSATQAAGVYTLAGGVRYFDETLSLGTATKNYGSITVGGEVLRYRNRDFKLETADDSLILTVTRKDDVQVVNGKVIRYDGTLDVHTGSGTQTAGAIDSSNWTLLGGGSFGGGGNSGLLWQENSTGNVYMQNNAEDVSDLTAKSNLLGTVTEGYEIGGIGDFFGTGRDGALLLTPSFGDSSVSLNYGLAVWAQEGNGSVVPGWLGALVNTWEETGKLNQLKGDFQGLSGEARNQVINANNYRYELVGTADFNGDGKTDVMLRNNMPTTVSGETITGSGDVFIFLTDSHDNVLTGNRPAEGICYAGCATGGWNVVGFGDFNGDGIDDALLSDGSNLAGWMIQSGQRIGDYWFGPLGDWQFAGVGDFTGDGTADILVSQGNEFAVWTVKNGAVFGSIAIA